MKEKLHLPLYDAFFVPGVKNGTAAKTFTETMTDPRVVRFFVDVQNKTKLETNLQAAGVLPSLNTFEARAMRVVASTFCVSRAALAHPAIRTAIVTAADNYCDAGGSAEENQAQLVKDIRSGIEKVIGPVHISEYSRTAIVTAADTYCKLQVEATEEDYDRLVNTIVDAFTVGCELAGTFLAELIYNSVTSLLVGEKIMIEMPTFWFPAGAGVDPGNGTVTNHGEPDPMATFRFAEPVLIEPQQNFRVEMLFPQGVPRAVAEATGPIRIWVVLDGYLTRDVQ
jgi:hypothetical protein